MIEDALHLVIDVGRRLVFLRLLVLRRSFSALLMVDSSGAAALLAFHVVFAASGAGVGFALFLLFACHTDSLLFAK